MVVTAVLIDGAYFVKRFRAIEPRNAHDGKRAAEQAWRYAVRHLAERNSKSELYRIFFYDCPPVEKKMHLPFSKEAIDFSKSPEALFRRELHNTLRCKRKVALRLGTLAHAEWTLRSDVERLLLKGKKSFEEITDDDVILDVRQKGVDMRIGLDIASLTFKRQVSKIVLMAGDADFVPAAKLARREGIDFVLDPMWRDIPDDLNEHIDGLRSVCPRPRK
ncbi:NYN domain-containing protein [Acidithiobacillus ferriphilus]|uniref:NYN domain-containing protein n=1 Tax=Acidithiobacillus ferriphilus TaxID=1689834 RepID=UPI001C062ED3|nr:NYN domain-containing protein [Acidithiobacillus ferriphilus]MBU2786189.1 NYN domain-containing protein [Acidithiobacillus ferriphilus]UEP59891.1 NYN domain-containing protein [Acidithiobacillus ferriphilus]